MERDDKDSLNINHDPDKGNLTVVIPLDGNDIYQAIEQASKRIVVQYDPDHPELGVNITIPTRINNK